ncbi:hypothetical protein [Candidatus Leptofilum sp.]|uniref:hypothetical protein n=1 Tax=Candidatus Leptofilum sp. TaxID=3241576 RepID=UPI003B5B5CB1
MAETNSLINLEDKKLREGVRIMCEWLGIPGNATNLYDLYEAVFREQEKARKHTNELNEILEKLG